MVHRSGPWAGSTKVVHGPGPQGWSMDRGSMFCIRPPDTLLHARCVYTVCTCIEIDGLSFSNGFYYRSSCFSSRKQLYQTAQWLGNVFKLNFILVYHILAETTKTPVCNTNPHTCFFHGLCH